ncbi:MAG: polysaccharide export protein [Candidatus Omnitrophica bacterium]|nr:polysaccharide export protein [Candidatus Omnitrophota bacterium]MCB9746937.1 polysaccharide export protein [Candidatus Omnitrophota bacterium]
MRFQRIKLYIVCLISTMTVLMYVDSLWAQNFAGHSPATIVDPAVENENVLEEAFVVPSPELVGSSNEGFAPEDLNIQYQSSSKYTLGANDVIEVSVMRHPEVSGQFVINAEGKIQYEFVGDVIVAGLTKQEVADRVTMLLEKYIISPEVTVKILGYNSKVVYVIGEVGNSGKIFMRGDTITVREALVQAGLPLLSAKSTKSVLFTPSASGKVKKKKVNVHKLLYEGDLRENLVMKPGDTLYIPPTVMAKAMRVIQPVAAPISSGAGAARTVTTGF